MSSSLTLVPAAPRQRGALAAWLHALLLDLRPILTTLRRHRIAAGLIVLEVALACTIITNALHLIQTRVDALGTDSGLAESEIAVLEVRYSKPLPPEQARGVAAADMVRLRGMPGVKDATSANQIVYGNNANNSGVTLEPDNASATHIVASQYAGDEHLLPTFGLKLVAGRNFTPDEVLDSHKVFSEPEPRIGQVIINQRMADKFFPDRSPLGQSIYVFGKVPSTVVGVVQTLTNPYLHRADNDGGYALLFPLQGAGTYVLRGDPAGMDARINAASATLEAADAGRAVTKAQPLVEMRAAFYAQDRAMAWLMGGICVALLLVTAMGIVGLASFWVQQRTRMIGTRRALGATEGQIQRYFQLENLLLTGTGVLIGLAGAVALNQWLMQSWALPRLPWGYLPAAALLLGLLGQLAVWVPARRAAQLAPVAALRA